MIPSAYAELRIFRQPKKLSLKFSQLRETLLVSRALKLDSKNSRARRFLPPFVPRYTTKLLQIIASFQLMQRNLLIDRERRLMRCQNIF
jgi:hypothetical protein